MLRTNCRTALKNIRNYIVDNSNFDSYGIETPASFKDCAVQLMHIFYDEKAKWDKRRMSYQDLFVDWLQGLPSAFDSLYYYNRSAVNDLGDILEETEAERNKYTEAEAEKMLSYLIWREIYKACEYTVK